ncbi:L-lactate dehydrogenase [Sphingomonas qomolangmaensis]|uniref:L-lactate dehydrogenase n=1 Tax=Sphingomonas qomolangmaensis TaxID=2918765 RepID=A0ABY5LBP2_9SPHN|nr:L-lactate dehydrogenase [Sphingomonas qomolangmaensis]UUL83438.1 L-lactate dehydrogenase [Sphingomonas qomolangmaensis]
MTHRIAIIGAGHVGATAAYALMLRALVREIVLIDANQELAEAEAADLADADALARPARIWAGDYADAASAGIAVLTAGAATHGDESRLSVASRSAAIVEQCVASLMDNGFDGILLVAANPVDLMAQVALRASGLPPERVIGTGTLLDSARLRQTLAERFDVAPSAVEGFVLGEHGDSEVAVFSTIRVGGLPLDTFAAAEPPLDRAAIATEVREAGYRIATGKGYTSFGIATAIVRICEAVLRDERSVLPVSTMPADDSGFGGTYMSLPCLVGAGGIERQVLPELTDEERDALKRSSKALEDAMEGMKRDSA